MKEIWKDIPHFENSYQVSNFGRVKSLDNKSNHKKEIILKQSLIMKYKCVSLSKNGEQKIFKVHRLVAEAFIQNPNNLPQVNHKDGNKENNFVENLEFCTASENVKHAYKIGLKKNKKGKENLRSYKVYMLDDTDKVINEYGSLREAERKTGLWHSNISQSIIRKGKCGGYKWKIVK